MITCEFDEDECGCGDPLCDHTDPYVYTPPSPVLSQARRNALGKALCLAELDAAQSAANPRKDPTP